MYLFNYLEQFKGHSNLHQSIHVLSHYYLDSMYSVEQILFAKNDPRRITRSKLFKPVDQIRAIFPHDIGIQGSYRTGNIGDLAIGMALSQELTARGYDTKIFGRNVSKNSSRFPILGGGGVLHDWYGMDHLRNRLNFIDKSGAIIGVGVPGFRSEEARSFVREKLQDVRLITVRDKTSKMRLREVIDDDIYVTSCPAFMLDDPREQIAHKTGVNFRPWFDLDSDVLSNYFNYNSELDVKKAKKKYINNSRKISNLVEDPIFIPFHEDDEEFAKKHLDIPILPYKFSPQVTLQRVSSVEKMVATRYHSLVFSIITNKPTLVIGYAPKVSDLADRSGIKSWLPHSRIELNFEQVNNRKKIFNKSKENISLLTKYF